MKISNLIEGFTIEKEMLLEAKQLPTDIELALGSQGQSVVDYQNALTAIGISPGPSDGVYGRETKAATIVFQNKNDLRTDGIAGVKTLTALNNKLSGKSTKSATPVKTPKKPLDKKWGRVNVENVKVVYDVMTNQGFTPAQSAGLVGNFSVESLFKNDPAKAVNPNDSDGKPRWGLAQWDQARWNRLGKFINDNPKNSTLKQQAEFVVHELESTHAKAGAKLKNITGNDMQSVADAVFVVRRFYEVAHPAADAERLRYAKLAFDEFSDKTADTSGPSSLA